MLQTPGHRPEPAWARGGNPVARRARAAPGDAVVQMLQERGILPTAAQLDANPLVQQMRDVATDMVLSAMNFLGVPYRRGGNTPNRASTAAASHATCSKTAWAWCCRAAPTSRRRTPGC
jgi:hypothetical protein